MKGKRNKYHQQSHVSDILWHFLGPNSHDGNDYEVALKRLETYISDDCMYIELGPNTLKSAFYIRTMTIPQQEIGVSDTPKTESQYVVYEPKALCFCDIPISNLPLHMDKYGDIGIGIRRRKVNESFFDKIKPVHYYPYISESILERENKKLWDIEENEITLKSFVKIPTLLNSDAYEISDSSEPFEYIYQEREWRSVERIRISVKELAYILLPSRDYISDKFPKLKKVVQNGIGLIIAKDMYRVKDME